MSYNNNMLVYSQVPENISSEHLYRICRVDGLTRNHKADLTGMNNNNIYRNLSLSFNLDYNDIPMHTFTDESTFDYAKV